MKHGIEEQYSKLWFDVERRYKTILTVYCNQIVGLWFDVERRYKTIKTMSEASIR